MKLMTFIIFFSIVLLIYTLVNYYIYKRLACVLPAESIVRTIILAVFFFLVSSYFTGRILEKFYLSHLSDVLIWVGAFWMAYMLYSVLFLLVIDLLRLTNYLIPFFPDFITRDPLKTKQIFGSLVFVFVSVIVLSGFINSRIITNKVYNLTINKSGNRLNELKIVMFSDLHLGTIIGKNFAANVVANANSLNPDIILIPGDVIDEDIEPVLKDGICEELQKFKSKYGVYAVTGNHEYIGNAETAVSYLEKNGIKVLRDTSTLIDSSFYLVGREDNTRERATGKKRKQLADLLSDIDKTLPIIMMDHQPFNLDDVQSQGVDLQFSGHTHNGQLWPFNYLTELIYEVSWGYKQKGNSQFYVSCGVGGWGPPVRIGSRPEIVTVNLKFN